MQGSGMEKNGRKRLAGREFYVLLVLVLSFNMVLWLDSFDRYLSSRYHFYLSQYLPDAAYAPSRAVAQRLALGESADPGAGGAADDAATGGDGSGVDDTGAADDGAPAIAGQPLLAASSPAATLAASVAASAPIVAGGAPASAVAGGLNVAAASAPAQAPAAGGAPARARVAQAADGPRVLFAGDSMMQGVAPIVISRLRRIYPHGVFVDASKESTGLTVKRYFDWPTKIRDECVSQGLRTVVIFLGPNDPWDIYERRQRYIFPSDKWEQKYRNRVDEVLEFAAASGVRVIWVGLPVMREDRIEQGAKIENRIFQEETKKYKFEFVSTGDLLGAVGQPYKKYIEDPKKGKIVVRADDGIHFTSKGLRMISSRIEDLLSTQDKL